LSTSSSQTPHGDSLRARVPEKNSQLVELAERADRRMEKCRNRRTPLSLADLEFMKNDVHEAVELGHKARFLWLSADERADNLAARVQQLLDERESVHAEAERKVRAEIAADFEQLGKRQGSLTWGEAVLIAREGLCVCRGGSQPCDAEGTWVKDVEGGAS